MHRAILLLILGALLTAGWFFSLGVILADMATPQDRPWLFAVLGTMYGQATVMALWAAWGPGRLVLRGPLACFWIGICVAIWYVPIVSNPQAYAPDLLVIAGSTLGQVTLACLLSAALRLATGVRIDAADAPHAGAAPGAAQFGIRQLMLLTAVIACLLGAGRVLAPWLRQTFEQGNWREVPVFCFIVAANLVIALPAALGVLLPRRALLGTGVALAFFTLATWLELSLLSSFEPVDDEVYWLISMMNALQVAWMLLAAGLVRGSSYRLSRRIRAREARDPE